MQDRERRSDALVALATRRAQLNPLQRETLDELERFGWELKFVRCPVFQESLPVVSDDQCKRYSLLKPDGTLDDNPGFDIRS